MKNIQRCIVFFIFLLIATVLIHAAGSSEGSIPCSETNESCLNSSFEPNKTTSLPPNISNISSEKPSLALETKNTSPSTPLEDHAVSVELPKGYETYPRGPYTVYEFKQPSFVSYATDFVYPGLQGFSAELWVRTTENHDMTFISSGEYSTHTSGWSIGLQVAQTGVLFIRVYDEKRGYPDVVLEGPQSYGTKTLNDGNWHHIIAVRDRHEQKIKGYVDGELDLEYKDGTENLQDTNHYLLLGRSDPLLNDAVEGDIAIQKLYDYALTPSEIAQHYHQEESLFDWTSP